MNKAVLLITGLSLALSGCGKPASTPAPLAGAKIGGAFTLTDQDGKRFSSDRLSGRYAVIYFGYTYCPDVCPTDMLNLGKGLKAFEAQDAARAAKVQPVFISVDPARDTPPVIKQFVANFHSRLIGLTGSEAEIAAVAKLYAAPYAKEKPAPGATGYLMQHSSVAILFGPDQKPIAMVPVDTDAKSVRATLDQWVQ